MKTERQHNKESIEVIEGMAGNVEMQTIHLFLNIVCFGQVYGMGELDTYDLTIVTSRHCKVVCSSQRVD